MKHLEAGGVRRIDPVHGAGRRIGARAGSCHARVAAPIRRHAVKPAVRCQDQSGGNLFAAVGCRRKFVDHGESVLRIQPEQPAVATGPGVETVDRAIARGHQRSQRIGHRAPGGFDDRGFRTVEIGAIEHALAHQAFCSRTVAVAAVCMAGARGRGRERPHHVAVGAFDQGTDRAAAGVAVDIEQVFLGEDPLVVRGHRRDPCERRPGARAIVHDAGGAVVFADGSFDRDIQKPSVEAVDVQRNAGGALHAGPALHGTATAVDIGAEVLKGRDAAQDARVLGDGRNRQKRRGGQRERSQASGRRE